MPAADHPSPMNHVLVDFENVHEIDLGLVGAKSVSFILLLGAQQKRLDVEVVEKLMEHASSVQLVRLTSNGRNALDFALAYYLGHAAAGDPAARFHIVSKDTGFDPLIEHLRSRRLRVWRHVDFSTLALSSKVPSPAPDLAESDAATDELFGRALEHLRQHPKNRPKRTQTLERHLLALSGKGTTAGEIAKLIERLRSGGYVAIDEKGAVTYRL